MRDTKGVPRISDADRFGELNFHPSHLLEELTNWLTDDAGLPLVVQGEHGSGREYCLRAACYNQELHDLPWTVVSVDWAQQGCRTLGELVNGLAEQPEIKATKIDWLAEVAGIFNLEKGPAAGATLPITIVLQVAQTLELARTLLDAWTIPTVPLPGNDPFTALRRLLETILADRNLILHIRNADLLDMGMTAELLDIGMLLDAEAMAEQRQGRLLLAFSCSVETLPTGLLGRRRDQIRILYMESPTEQDLRRLMDRNFSPNRFDDDLIAALHQYGRAEEKDNHGFSAEIAEAVRGLLNKGVLIWEDGCWLVNPDRSEQSLNTIIGLPLYRLYRERLASIDHDLLPHAERFMELAALCRQWIPQQLLLDYMELDEDQGDCLLDSLEAAFVETEPALLIDEEYNCPGFTGMAVFRFAVPLLAVSLLPRGDRAEEAKELLAFFEQRLPKGDRAAAALCWQLAEQAGPGTRQRWQEQLAWYFAPELAERFSDMLLGKLRAGLISPFDLLRRAVKEKDRQPVHFLRAIISACDRWYQEQGGVPANQEGALFLSLFGSLLYDLGQYEEALEQDESALAIRQRVLPADHQNIATILAWIGSALGQLGRHEEALKKQEAALAIRQRVLSEDHPDIASSLNNIGLTLGSLGRHEEALEKLEAALNIRQSVLPEDHPDIAQSLNNIGSTLGDLGQYEEALEKLEAALDIRQRVLPAEHPDIALSLNNIGSALNEVGRHEEALEKLKAALAINQRVLPADHPHIAISLSNIGKTLSGLNRHEEALKELAAALDIQQRVLPKDHPHRAITLRRIGNALGGLNRHKEALAKYEAALDSFQHSLPAEHPHIAETRNLIKQCLENMEAQDDTGQ